MNMHIRLLHTLQAELQFSHPHSIKKASASALARGLSD